MATPAVFAYGLDCLHSASSAERRSIVPAGAAGILPAGVLRGREWREWSCGNPANAGVLTLAQGHVSATQFHPERSRRIGLLVQIARRGGARRL